MFFNGTAIVVAVTIDALVTQRLQEALRAAPRRGARRRGTPTTPTGRGGAP